MQDNTGKLKCIYKWPQQTVIKQHSLSETDVLLTTTVPRLQFLIYLVVIYTIY